MFVVGGFHCADHDKRFNGSFLGCVDEAKGSAAALVNIIVDNFPCFDDRHRFEDQTVRFHKRAQILVADLWACVDGESYGCFHDIDKITMFAGRLLTIYLLRLQLTYH